MPKIDLYCRSYIVRQMTIEYRAKLVKDYVENSRIKLMFLPAYSPNLNVIERLWRFFHKKITINKYYEKYSDFRDNCMLFFRKLKKYKIELKTLLTDNFQILDPGNPEFFWYKFKLTYKKLYRKLLIKVILKTSDIFLKIQWLLCIFNEKIGKIYIPYH